MVANLYEEFIKLVERLKGLNKDYNKLYTLAKMLLEFFKVKTNLIEFRERRYYLDDFVKLTVSCGGVRLEFAREVAADSLLVAHGLSTQISSRQTIPRALYIVDNAPKLLKALRKVEEEAERESEAVRRALRELEDLVGILTARRELQR